MQRRNIYCIIILAHTALLLHFHSSYPIYMMFIALFLIIVLLLHVITSLLLCIALFSRRYDYLTIKSYYLVIIN